MTWRKQVRVLTCVAGACLLTTAQQGASHIQVRTERRIFVDGTPVFPVGFTMGPPTGMIAPDGQNAMRKLVREGHVFQLWYCPPHHWNASREAQVDALLREANQQGMKVVISIADLQKIAPGDTVATEELARVVRKYRDNPAVLFWKGDDEPQWGKVPVKNLQVYRDTIHQLDPHHPIWITQAPRGTVADWRPYSAYFDVGAVDIYPISYPPGIHSGIGNKNISVVGDYAQRIREATDDSKPTMMVLQICWSGVAKPGATLRMPTFSQERYMAYQAIIDGARGLVFFGGNVPACQNSRDAAYGWNWTFYDQVLKPVLDQFRPDGPLYPALIAPAANLAGQVSGSNGLEYAVRQSGRYIYILAAEREGPTVKVTFSGLPLNLTTGQVLFESPRSVHATGGEFSDWFGPNEVHVYRFRVP